MRIASRVLLARSEGRGDRPERPRLLAVVWYLGLFFWAGCNLGVGWR